MCRKRSRGSGGGRSAKHPTSSPPWADWRSGRSLLSGKPNLESLGRTVKSKKSDNPPAGRASSDFGNVSQLVPATSAIIAIAGAGTQLHSPEFAAAAASEAGIKGMLDGARALALTVVDLLASPAALGEIKEEFQGNRQNSSAASPAR